MPVTLKTLFELFKDIAKFNEPLAKYTSFKIGGPAEVLLAPTNRDQLIQCYQLCLKHNLPVHVLGGGTNLLVSDEGVKGVVIKPELTNLTIAQNEISVETGFVLAHLVTQTIKSGLKGLEVLVGIPGTVGGAVAVNAGGHHGYIGEPVKSVTLLNQQGAIETLQQNQIEFGYRSSNLKNKGIIIEIVFELTQENPDILYQNSQNTFNEKRTRQPLASYSAGCVFKNPPQGPSAGELIEQAGLKGLRVGGAEISTQHANYIINTQSASASNVQTLIKKVQETISNRFHIQLELELQIW